MPCQLAIIADDLTGACDTALQFARAGLRAEIVLGNQAPCSSGSDVLAFDSDSRDCTADQAYRRVSATMMRAGAYGPTTIYKKVDSTLRGNVGRELDALLDAGGAEAVLLAPAFPALGRTVKGGQLLFQGQLLTDTPFAAALPVASSSVAAIVSSTAQTPVGTLQLAQLRAGPEAVVRAMHQALADGRRIIVADAASDADLGLIAATLAEHPAWLAAGSAGLAAAIATLFPRNPNTRADDRLSPATIQQPVLTIVGSAHPVALAQRQLLAAATGQALVMLDPAALEHQRLETITQLTDQLRSILKKNTSAILTTTAVDSISNHTLDRALAGALGEIAAGVAPFTGAMILTGGDTAAATLRQLQAQAIVVVREVRSGMPLLMVRGGISPGLAVITKSGGFGGPEYLRDAHDELRMTSYE